MKSTVSIFSPTRMPEAEKLRSTSTLIIMTNPSFGNLKFTQLYMRKFRSLYLNPEIGKLQRRHCLNSSNVTV